ncbi:MAG: amylo-alpha-1,6-glucosidase [Chloroflexota bacterium]
MGDNDSNGDAAVATLSRAARDVLDGNWRGRSTVPSPSLYPHQWSWDSAFIALGRSRYDQARAQQELLTLFRAQWSNGMVPHIVYDSSVDDTRYFPGPAFWDSARSPHAPRGMATSGITQPPIHARVAMEMHRHAIDAEASSLFLKELYPKLALQHEYLARERDPADTGLPVIVHPWESGLDNSPVWDRDLREMEIPEGALPPYTRYDIVEADPADRPRDGTYDRFVYMAVRYRDTGYDDAVILAEVPFAIAGPLFSAITLWSTHALAEIAEVVGADALPHRERAERIHASMLEQLWDEDAQYFYARDVLAGHLEPEDTIVSFTPLLDPDLPAAQLDAILASLESKCFSPTFVVPTFNVNSPDFERRRYWRGPIWLNTNWLLWSGLQQHGRHDEARRIASSSLRLVAGQGFREYFDPFDATGYGTDSFGWSAALTLDMMARLGDAATELLHDGPELVGNRDTPQNQP